MLAAGLSLREIADRLGVDASTVGKVAKRFGLEVPGRVKYAAKPVDGDDLRDRVAGGATQRELARHFGVSVTTVQRHLARHGLRTAGRQAVGQRRHGRPERRGACAVHGLTTLCRDGRGTWRCRRCRSDAVARRRRTVKETLVAEAGGACALCGYSRYLGALHFHHVDPATKRFGLGQGGWTRGIDALREEARKCVLLCSNCHAEVEAAIVRLPQLPAAGSLEGTVGGSSIRQSSTLLR